MIGGVHVGAGMGADLQKLNAPAVALGQVVHGAALKETRHLFRRVLVVAVLDTRDLNLRVAGQIRLNGDGKINDFHT